MMRASATRGARAALVAVLFAGCTALPAGPRGTGDLGIVVERETGSVQIVDHTRRTSLARVTGLGDLSHAAAVYSRDGRYAFVFGRDGGLTKVDLLERRITARTVQGGNSIGGAISQDGRLVAVANYEPGGIKLFDADTLTLLSEVPSTPGPDGKGAKVVGIADAPGNRFVYSLFEAGEIWIVDASDPRRPESIRLRGVGKQPYDGLITPDGRYYIAGLFGEDGLALVDLWNVDLGAKRILDNYGQGAERLPVYKMPHLRGWVLAGGYAFLPAIGRNEVLIVDARDWKRVGAVPVHGQPVFAMARPDGRQVWVNFAFPANDTVQVIDVATLKVVEALKPGRAVLHMEFTARGEEVWVSSRDDNRLVVYDTATFARRAELPAQAPSGIFFTWRAHRIGL